MEQIDSGAVHLWLCFYESIRDRELLNEYWALLSAEERRQQRQFYFERDRHRYLVTRAMVRTVLSKYARIAPEQWLFNANQYGKPEVWNQDARANGISFNLSHTSGLIVIVLGIARDRAIGVDVENVRQQRAALEVAERYFAPQEVSALRMLPREEQGNRFFEYWTLKESYIKARGMGLSIPFGRFAFNLEEPGLIRLSIEPTLRDRPECWDFWQFMAAEQSRVALCVARFDGVGALQVRRTSPLLHESPFEIRLLRTVATSDKAV